jgi:hypothetical protein
MLLAKGVHARIVMETLGRSQVSLTLDTDSHVLPSLQAEAALRMDEARGCQQHDAPEIEAQEPTISWEQ